MQFIQQNYKFI